MFKADAKLFISANNNFNYAKTLINECKKLVTEITLSDNVDYRNLKNNMNHCDVEKIENTIETTKKSLMRDQAFAEEYMTLIAEYLNTNYINESMSDEEKMQYNIVMNGYVRDYNYNLLYILESYEDSGMLIPELELQLEMQRAITEQYEIQDQMAILLTTSQEYIDLFKENAKYDRKIINLTPNLTDDQKTQKLEEYDVKFNSQLDLLELNRDVNTKNKELEKLDVGTKKHFSKQNEIYQLQINYLNNKKDLTDEEKQTLNDLKNYKQLNNLYIKEIEVNSNYIPFDGNSYKDDICELKVEMGIATESEKEYLNMNGFERAIENTGAFLGSTFEGLFKVEEQIFDGIIMLAGGIYGGCGGDTTWAQNIVKFDMAGNAYSGYVSAVGLNNEIAYGEAHSTGNFIGEALGTIALQFLPGGNLVMVGAHALQGAGKAGEKNLNSGKSFFDSFWSSMGSGTIEGVASYFLYGRLGPDTKVADLVGSKITNIGTYLTNSKYIKPVTEFINRQMSPIISSVGNKIPSVAKNYAGNYLKQTMKPSLVTKYFVAGGKEIAKEMVNFSIYKEFDEEKFWDEFMKSMTITTINEFVVAPNAKLLGQSAGNKAQQMENNANVANDISELTSSASAKNIITIGDIRHLTSKATKTLAQKLLISTETTLASDVGNKFLKKASKEYINNNAFA